MAHIIKCRLCKQSFDTEKEDFVLVGKKSYYHKGCYEEWVKSRNNAKSIGDADFWRESVIDYLYRDIKMSINFTKFDSQWNSFTKPEKRMTPKGIYFAIRYYYDVMHGDKEKALGGIGIVQNIYSDAAQYWNDLELRKMGTIDAITEQIKMRAERPVQTVIHKAAQPAKSKFNLNDI